MRLTLAPLGPKHGYVVAVAFGYFAVAETVAEALEKLAEEIDS